MRLDLSGDRPRIDLDSLPLPPTPAQRRALDIGRELAVTAGAGAGKTQTLSLRYAVLMLELAVDAALDRPTAPRPAIEQVLVLTFTEKAAEEMASRCYRRLLALSRAVRSQSAALDQRYGPSFGASLSAAVDHLIDTADRASIATFHGFCARVLRRYPAESRTPPGFEVLEEADALLLRDQAIDEALRGLIATRPQALAPLIDAFNRHGRLVEALQIALDQRGRVLGALQAHAEGRVDLARRVSDAIPPPAEVRDWLVTEASPLLDQVCILAGPGRSAYVRDVLQPLRVRAADPPSDALACNALYADVLGAVCIKDSPRDLKHFSVVGRKASWPSPSLYDRHKAALDALGRRLRDWPARLAVALALPMPADLALERAMREFAVVALDAIERQRARFDARRELDFAELQIRAVRAVTGSPELCGRLADRHRWIMVDEFQDTDEAQWALVRALGRPTGQPAGRLFVVGDVKQSIYGFRGGDVTVFRAASDQLGGQPVVLRDNFRSRDALICWYNAVFQSVLGPADPQRPPWEAPYEPLAAGRAAQGGSVTLVAHDAAPGVDAAMAEADGVARLIAGEILPGRGAYEGGGLLDRGLHPSPPVAVLLQRRTHLPFFERALREQGVPFVVARGVGFWSRQEVLDLVNTLHALATGDPISVVGMLRSPLFGVSDTELFTLGRGRTDALTRFGTAPLPEGASEALVAAWSAVRALLAVRDRLPVSALLRRVLGTGVAWHRYALDDDFGQAEANAERLVRLAARFDSRGPEGLETVADWFISRVEGMERESEASVQASAARVVIMTVHAAKGLEFPVVVVPQAGTRSPPDPSALTIARDGARWELAFKVPDPPELVQAVPGCARPIRRRRDPGLLRLLKDVARAESEAEDRRLLYVAVTRARDHLVVLGNSRAKAFERGSWMALLAEHHDDPLRAVDGVTLRGLDALRALEPVPLVRAPAPAPPGPDAARRIGPIAAPAEFEVSPSSLDLFEQCPARWVLRHVLRVPEHARRAAEDLPRRVAAVRGQVIHSLLEDDVVDDRAVARNRWRAAAHAAGIPHDQVGALEDTLWAHLRRTSADPRVAGILAAEGITEASFRIPVGNVVLRGQIDRLWRDPSTGEWVVLDWKSEAAPMGPLVAGARHERQLRAYAWAATRILAARGQPPVRRAMLYFTALGELYTYPTFDDGQLSAFETLLARVGETVAAPWQTVEEQAIASPVARPCAACGFAGRACRGRPAHETGLAIRSPRV